MYRNKTILGLITARGGSRGLPGKNIKLLAGKPLIGWTIDEARKSRLIDRIIVSTDDKEIAGISRRYGAEVPFMRPKKLASDKAKSIDVVLHAMDWASKNDSPCDLLALLQPTSPLRTAKDIDGAVELFFSKKAGSVVSVCETDHTPYWMNTLPKDGCMKDFINKAAKGKTRQELPAFYRINGAVYLARWDHLKEQRSFFGKRTFAYVMPKERSVDIDDETNFMFAEFLARRRWKR